MSTVQLESSVCENELPAAKKRKTCCSNGLDLNPMCLPSLEVLKSRKQHVAPSQKLHYGDYPLNIVKGEAQFLIDSLGQKYLDTTNNVACVGHCHPKVVEACCKQMALLNTNSRFLNERICTYSKKLCSKLPEKLSCCFFTNSGSEANDLALQIARVVTKRRHIISVKGCYHGHLISLRELSDYKMAKGMYVSSDISKVALPDVYRGSYRDPETAGSLYAREIQMVIDEQKDGIAGFIHESLFSCAGQIIPPNNYLKDAYKYVREAGGLVIADEIQCGFARVGHHFWGFQMQDVVPDIVTVGKPMGNGHPVSALITTKEIVDKFSESVSYYFNTFGGNPASMAIAEAVLDVIEEEKLQERSKVLGEFMTESLLALKEKHNCIGDVRGVGMFIGVDLVKDKETREPDVALAEQVRFSMLHQHKIIANMDGVHGNVYKFKPPLVFTKNDCIRVLDALDSILSETRT